VHGVVGELGVDGDPGVVGVRQQALVRRVDREVVAQAGVERAQRPASLAPVGSRPWGSGRS
jgi:hypothetical protein